MAVGKGADKVRGGYATGYLRHARVAELGVLLGIGIFVGALSAQAAHVFVYRWVDPENQQVHYSDNIPPDTGYEMVAVENPPPRDPDAERRLETIDAETNRWASAQIRELRLQEQDAADAAARGLDCARARSWLEKLNLRPGPRLRLMESDGTARRMTEDERQDRIADVEQSISTLCEGTP